MNAHGFRAAAEMGSIGGTTFLVIHQIVSSSRVEAENQSKYLSKRFCIFNIFQILIDLVHFKLQRWPLNKHGVESSYLIAKIINFFL